MADSPAHIDVRLSADLTVIRPGDTILVRMHRDAPSQQLLAVAERLRDRLPDVEVLVLAGADGIDIYRPGEPR
jgi:hypothetical protein